MEKTKGELYGSLERRLTKIKHVGLEGDDQRARLSTTEGRVVVPGTSVLATRSSKPWNAP